ncbi:hypothetical protein K435DRAFT_677870 [Dendrothele bispora CBS 962.96]|uniref:DUF659 domain-containing protein n=1 Tax=Dendrothele bispora (strain CBS 962.96) TaxID=1314807 RepID=A0A4S8LKN6_DENBC|nr:hypothetical protein K435DRAFT_677870 [Dendrothele bispora CBS 962.96]
METRDATDESHTGEWIKRLAMKWIELIGQHRFCAVCSDSTGNTLLAQTLINEEVPTILPFADCCHHLDNTNKAIVELDYFDETIKTIRSTIRSFSQSHVGRAELQKARDELLTGAGLEAIGKTRFMTVVLSALLVQRNLPAIKQVVKNGKFEFESSDSFQPSMDRVVFEFEFRLRQLIDICLPIAKALTCLEANDANPADIFIYWHAVIFEIKRILDSTKRRVNTLTT